MNANFQQENNNQRQKLEIARKKEDLEIKVDRSEIMESFKDLVGPSFVLCNK